MHRFAACSAILLIVLLLTSFTALAPLPASAAREIAAPTTTAVIGEPMRLREGNRDATRKPIPAPDNKTDAITDRVMTVSDLPTPVAPPPPGRVEITGRVVTVSGLPMRGVEIRTNTGVTTTTDLNGQYRIVDLPAGAYSLSASTPGYTFNDPIEVTVSQGSGARADFTGTPNSVARTPLIFIASILSSELWVIPDTSQEILAKMATVFLLVMTDYAKYQNDPSATVPSLHVPKSRIRVSANTFAPPSVNACNEQTTFEPANALDGRFDTAWRVPGNGIDSYIQLDFDTPVQIDRLYIVPGYAKTDPCDSTNRFLQNRRVRRVMLTFENSEPVIANLKDEPSLQAITFPTVTTRWVRVTITSTTDFNGTNNGRDFTPISEIDVDARYP